MAEGGDLTPEQTETLLHFQDMTGIEEMERCREILERHHWQLEPAVQDTFNIREGIPSPFSAPPPPPPSVRTPLVNADAFYQTRIIARRPHRPISWWDWGTFVITFPFRFIYSTVMDVFRFFYRLFRLDPRQHVTDPEGDVRSFIAKFNEDYGDNHPVFYQGTYGQALTEAKNDLRFLLVYLQDNDNLDSADFCQSSLCHFDVTEYILNNNMLFWACSVDKPEGFRVSRALRANTYPFLALLVLRENKMTVVARVEGPLGPEDLVQKVSRIVHNNEMALTLARADREERDTNRTLRQMQDDAYQQSLEADREKERLKRQEQQRLQKLEEEEMQKQLDEEQRLEEITQRKIQLRSEIPEEPSIDDPDAIKIVLKLPNGTRLERRFNCNQSLKHLHDYVFCNEEAPDDFQIITNFPRKSLPCQQTEEFEPPTFKEVGLGKNEMLFVHDNEA